MEHLSSHSHSSDMSRDCQEHLLLVTKEILHSTCNVLYQTVRNKHCTATTTPRCTFLLPGKEAKKGERRTIELSCKISSHLIMFGASPFELGVPNLPSKVAFIFDASCHVDQQMTLDAQKNKREQILNRQLRRTKSGSVRTLCSLLCPQ